MYIKEEIMRSKRAFTLIELLVVIAIIGLLLAIIAPALKKATAYARKINCQSNLHQIGVAMSVYESKFNYNFRNIKTARDLSSRSPEIKKTWFWDNGTSDYAHEQAPYAINFLMNSGILPDSKIFFCPGYTNLSHAKNYPVSNILNGNFDPWNTEDIFQAISSGQLPATDKNNEKNRPLFWGTYAWLWKKEIRLEIRSVNNLSSGALMSDMVNASWGFSAEKDPTRLGALMNNVNISRKYQHGNVLMQDYSLENPSDQDAKLVQWLWDSAYWAGDTNYPPYR